MTHVESAQRRPIHATRAGAPRAALPLALLLAAAVPLMSATAAQALSVRTARVLFYPNERGDRADLRGDLESFPQSIEAFPSVRVDIGPFSQTIASSRFVQRVLTDGTPTRRYHYLDRDVLRHDRPGIYRMELDFARGRFRVDARHVPLQGATNPMPFRLAAGLSDQCVMVSFAERPTYLFAYDYDAEGQPIAQTRRVVVDGARHPRWSYLRDATQPNCTLLDFQAEPRGFSVNRPVRLRFEARVPAVAVSGLQVFEVDDRLENVGGARCDLHDDGRDGDDVAGDRVASCRIEVFEHEPRLMRLVARGWLQGQPLTSPKIEIDVVPELAHEDAAIFIENVHRARDLWGEKLAQYGNTATARQQTADAIRALPYVWDVAYNERTFLMEFSVDQGNGVLAYLPITGSEGRNGPVPPGSMSEALPEPSLQTPMAFARYENVNSLLSQAVAQPEDDRVKSTRVLFWSPYHDFLHPHDEIDGLRHRFASNACPRFDVDMYRDNQCTLATVKRFTDYGTLVLATDSAFDPGKLELFKDKILEQTAMLITNETASPAKVVFEIADLVVRWVIARAGVPGVPERRSPRLVLVMSRDGAVVWGVRPEYIAELDGRFPDSVVFAGWGYSARANTFASVFQSKGARAYFGFDGIPSVPFVNQSINGTFDAMLDGGNAVEAFAALASTRDPNGVAQLALLGTGRATYEGLSGVLNGDFEKSTLSGWADRGDARVVSRLGPYGPRQGAFLGLLSTGLGETVDGGALSQRLCVGADQRWLRFDWNFLSEEFLNFCDQGYDDRFQVKVNGIVVFERSVDQLCGGPLSPVPGLTFDVQDDVWGSNWQSASVDLHALTQGHATTLDLEFLVVDQGDQTYDSVVLLDRIRFES